MRLDRVFQRSNVSLVSLSITSTSSVVTERLFFFTRVAGFVMKGFLGGWTLAMKSIGLVGQIIIYDLV